MHIIDMYWFLCSCRYWDHLGVELFLRCLGGGGDGDDGVDIFKCY